MFNLEKNMNFWHMQLHPNDPISFDVERIKKQLKEKPFIGFGIDPNEQEKGKALVTQFKDKMQNGDIVVIKTGETPIALVRVTGEYFVCKDVNPELDWFPHRREIEILDFYKNHYGFTIDQPRGTLSICKDLKTATSQKIIGWHKKIMGYEEIDASLSLLNFKKQIILQGPPGTGKTRLAKLIAEEITHQGDAITEQNEVISQGEYQIVQFHPAYSYEDFVRGIVAETSENGNISYKVKNKVLAEFAKKAQNNPNGKYVLIIDEINRANLPSVLGELIYALEYRGEAVTTMYEFEGDRQITLPENLYIIGTMNTADRSVGHIDYAIRRRFAFVNVQPDETIIENQKAKILFKEVEKLFSSEHLSLDFQKEDVMIGHSYFLIEDKNEAELKIKLDYEIKPILKEYVKDGILQESTSEIIENLKV